MKNKIFFLSFLFFFLACSSEDSEVEPTENPIKNDFYYGAADKSIKTGKQVEV